MSGGKVLARVARPTTKSYRSAVKEIILRVQADHRLDDAELAERIGCSESTIKNARTEACDLSGKFLAAIEAEFGPGAIDPFYALGGGRSLPLDVRVCVDVNAPLELSAALHLLLATQHPNSEGGVATTPTELRPLLPSLRDARRAIDVCIALAGAE
ncbi:XRE family transcriptional regulator [uncultured Sphingomonas sp.]|uniref:XRE family transcriptional regulator n=1 Tax=uncultured Sphingomonas sp. TaxID=158754 RepID=UPI0025E1DA4B|nr:XRE family transcriptional regulator [uncultured Sphingomonas sp.]